MIKKVYNKIKSSFYYLITGKKIIYKGKVWKKIDKSAKININGSLQLCVNSFGGNGRNVLLRMDKNSELNVNGNCSIYYGCDIILFENAKLNLGNSFINSDAKIRCHSSITIKDNCAISHDFSVMDSNAHYLNGEKKTKPVVINDNVWIGTRVTILSGVIVGKGAVIAADSVVTKNVPEKCLVAGNPAKVIKENVEWH